MSVPLAIHVVVHPDLRPRRHDDVLVQDRLVHQRTGADDDVVHDHRVIDLRPGVHADAG